MVVVSVVVVVVSVVVAIVVVIVVVFVFIFIIVVVGRLTQNFRISWRNIYVFAATLGLAVAV